MMLEFFYTIFFVGQEKNACVFRECDAFFL